MRLDPLNCFKSKPHPQAFTLVEVVMSIVIVATVFGGIILAYTQAHRRSKWSGYSLAAQSLSVQQIEQCRAAVWDPSTSPPKDEFSTLNLTGWTNVSGTYKGYSRVTFSLPVSTNGTTIMATNYVTVSTVGLSGFTNIQWRMVQVDTVWPFVWGSSSRLYTNRVVSYFAPDNP